MNRSLIEKLLEDIDTLVKEIQEQRRLNSHLENILFTTYEMADGNITRNMFRSFMKAELNREETDAEWIQFLTQFRHDTTDLNEKVYAWISENV